MRDKTCCFTGHRLITDEKAEELKIKIYDICEMLINRGFVRFVCGGAIGFDMLCAITVLALKKKHPGIRLVLKLPCRDQANKWSNHQKLMYSYIAENADEVSVLHERYVTGCMQERNRIMIDESSVCVAYLERSFGGTKFTVDYAIKRNLEVISI